MKPHIKRIYSIWYCAGSGVFAEGFTPSHAYAEWKKSSDAALSAKQP